MLQESAFILFNGNTEGTHVFAFLYHIYSSLLMQALIAVCRRSEIFFVFPQYLQNRKSFILNL